MMWGRLLVPTALPVQNQLNGTVAIRVPGGLFQFRLSVNQLSSKKALIMISSSIPVRLCVSLSVLLVVVGGQDASAQVTTRDGLDPYHHTYDADHGYVPVVHPGGYGYPGYGYGGVGGGTAAAGAGVAMAGAGDMAQGVGQMHLSNAQAQEAHQQAVSQYLSNVNQGQQTALETFTRREQATQQWDDAQKAKIQAQVALYNKTLEQMSAAHRLSAQQQDVTSGVLHWPFVLRSPQYTDLRNKIDRLYDARTPQDSGMNSSGYDEIQTACKEMQAIVNEEVKKGLAVNDYVTAKHFISSVAYEAQFPVKAPATSPPAAASK